MPFRIRIKPEKKSKNYAVEEEKSTTWWRIAAWKREKEIKNKVYTIRAEYFKLSDS